MGKVGNHKAELDLHIYGISIVIVEEQTTDECGPLKSRFSQRRA